MMKFGFENSKWNEFGSKICLSHKRINHAFVSRIDLCLRIFHDLKVSLRETIGRKLLVDLWTSQWRGIVSGINWCASWSSKTLQAWSVLGAVGKYVCMSWTGDFHDHCIWSAPSPQTSQVLVRWSPTNPVWHLRGPKWLSPGALWWKWQTHAIEIQRTN